jgi:ubiquinone/menaquinone biosynthesis C-methylase UbiE
MVTMHYDPQQIIQSYTKNAEIEDQSEKKQSLRVEIPREFIKRHIKPSDITLDAGGGTGVNAIMMAKLCQSVTLLDITPKILDLARKNITEAGIQDSINLVQGDICDLNEIEDESFTFVVCVGDALSYVVDQREKAIAELIRVARSGSILILGTDSKYGFLRLRLAQGDLEDARRILHTSTTTCGMGPKTHLYTVNEMDSMLQKNGCQMLEAASTPSLSDTINLTPFRDADQWDELKEIELEICNKPELLGVGLHLLFVARKL